MPSRLKCMEHCVFRPFADRICSGMCRFARIELHDETSSITFCWLEITFKSILATDLNIRQRTVRARHTRVLAIAISRCTLDTYLIGRKLTALELRATRSGLCTTLRLVAPYPLFQWLTFALTVQLIRDCSTVHVKQYFICLQLYIVYEV